MAELAIKIDAGAGYDDGDLLCAFNGRRIKCAHAENICHFRKAQRNQSGLIVASEVARDWYEQTHQYRFERVSAREMKRVELATGVEELFSDKPNEQGEAMDVRLFVARRKRQPLHTLFGEDGAEFWYGGQIDVSIVKLDRVWNAIETKTPLREANHRKYPAGTQSLKSFLYLSVDDFDDATAAEMETSETEADPETDHVIVVKKRIHRIDWEGRLSLTASERDKVRDKQQAFDMRGRAPFNRRSLVEKKPSKEKQKETDRVDLDIPSQ